MPQCIDLLLWLLKDSCHSYSWSFVNDLLFLCGSLWVCPSFFPVSLAPFLPYILGVVLFPSTVLCTQWAFIYCLFSNPSHKYLSAHSVPCTVLYAGAVVENKPETMPSTQWAYVLVKGKDCKLSKYNSYYVIITAMKRHKMGNRDREFWWVEAWDGCSFFLIFK